MITTVTGVLLLITLLLTFYLNEPQSRADETARDAIREQLEQAQANWQAKLDETASSNNCKPWP